mmetsp:Transcript_11121/g.34819  ORF Transcript_11121/g.34819 Transcript_11121/m.34819 type:complete len:134 (+) Transcript_11121:120-521(+)
MAGSPGLVLATACLAYLDGLLVAVGGVMGYVKAKSKASLIAGSTCGVITLVLAYIVSSNTQVLSQFALGAWAAVLAGMFLNKYKKAAGQAAAPGSEGLVEGGPKKSGGGIFAVLAALNLLLLLMIAAIICLDP